MLDKRKGGAKSKGKDKEDKAFVAVHNFGSQCFDQHGLADLNPDDLNYEDGLDCTGCGIRLPVQKGGPISLAKAERRIDAKYGWITPFDSEED